MISADDLRQLTARADQGYLLLFILGLVFAWIGFVLWRVPVLRNALTRIQLPLPALTLPMILIVGLVVRIPHLFDSFWYDETFTARMTALPLSQLPAAIIGDVHPPLWYAVEWLTVRLIGNSEFALRLPSLIFGVLFIALVYRMVLSLRLSRETALLSALIVSVLPTAAYYSAEARCYAFLSCLAVTLVIAIAEDRPWLFCVAGMLIVWSHNLGVFYLGVFGLAAIGFAFQQQRARYSERLFKGVMTTFVQTTPSPQWKAALPFTGLGASLWLPFLYIQSQRVAGGFWIDQLTPGGVLWYLTDGTIGRRMPDPFVAPVYLALFVLLLVGAVASRRWLTSSRGLLYLALIVGVPLSVALVSILWRPVYLTRALLPCGVGLVVIWAYALIHSPAKGALRLISGACLVTGLVSFYMPSMSRVDVRSFFEDCRGADAAYATSIPAAMFSAYYAEVPLTTWTEAGDLNQSLTPEAKAAFLLTSADDPPTGDVCLLTLDTPMTSDAERQEIERLKSLYPYTIRTPSVDALLVVHLYRFQIGEKPNEVVLSP